MMYQYQDLGDTAAGAGGGSADARQLLTQIGANGTQILLMTRYLFSRPLTSDPDAQGIIELVKVIQTGINKAGYFQRLGVDGKLGASTAAALDVIIPPKNAYANTPWLTILQAVQKAMKSPPKKVASSSNAPPMPDGSNMPLTTPGAGGFAELLKSPYVIGIGVFAGLVLLMGGKGGGAKKKSRSRRR
jgi:hypothetical protein